MKDKNHHRPLLRNYATQKIMEEVSVSEQQQKHVKSESYTQQKCLSKKKKKEK